MSEQQAGCERRSMPEARAGPCVGPPVPWRVVLLVGFAAACTGLRFVGTCHHRHLAWMHRVPRGRVGLRGRARRAEALPRPRGPGGWSPRRAVRGTPAEHDAPDRLDVQDPRGGSGTRSGRAAAAVGAPLCGQPDRCVSRPLGHSSGPRSVEPMSFPRWTHAAANSLRTQGDSLRPADSVAVRFARDSTWHP